MLFIFDMIFSYILWPFEGIRFLINDGFLCLRFRSFYVGDAAGRENDHSDADIKFAQVLTSSIYSLKYI